MGDNKTRHKNWCRQFARKVGPSDNSGRYSSVYDSLDRLVTLSERTASKIKISHTDHITNKEVTKRAKTEPFLLKSIEMRKCQLNTKSYKNC